MHPQDFVAKWRGNTSTERQVAQEHFLDVCALVGHATPTAHDGSGKVFTFEAGASKQSGGQGWADVWYKGHFAIEYKGPDKSLDKAYEQLLQYRESLENPPLLITGNTQEYFIHTNFTNSVKQVVRVTLDDLLTPQGIQHLRNIFYHPDAFRPELTAAQVTEEAAARFARLAEHLRKWGHPPHDIAHYLIRLLFCLFAEDTGLLPQDLFTRLVESGRRNPQGFNRQVRQLFRAMAEGDYFGVDEIRYFDGGLFDDDTVLDMDADGVAILYSIGQLDWSAIEPAIFGTLFTRSLDPAQRAKLGAQYTSKEDILLIVEPVLMAPLRREWETVKAEVRGLAERRDKAPTRAVATRAANDLRSRIEAFAQQLATIRVLDPACGSGNFLYVALRLLLDLWKEVAIFASELGLSMLSPLPGLAPSPEQLYGIEVNDYAHELAQATVWIGYLQWLHDNGYGFVSEPILKPLDNIKQMDAILTYDADGNPVEPEWPPAEVIVGNPPFLGGKRLKRELSEVYVDDLFRVFDSRVPRESDLVCYWFEKARVAVSDNPVTRVGLLSTNSIRGGANRRVLERIKSSGDLFWAESSRDWVLDGAAVDVSMIAFDSGKEPTKVLDGQTVTAINPDLTSILDTSVVISLRENHGLSYMGVTPAGPFDIAGDVARSWFAQNESNPDGRKNEDVVRPYFNGIDVVRRPRDVWIVDFGVNMAEGEARKYVAPFRHVEENVLPIRVKNNRESYRTYWWRHAESRPAMRKSLEGLQRYIGTSMVSKHHNFTWIPAEVLPANLLIVVVREDDYFFGVLHSTLHEKWSLRLGTSLEDRPRYTPSTTFETFPFPWPPGKEPTDDPRVQAIAAAAADLVAQRDAWLNPPGLSEKELQKRTLTNLYNERPAWLDAAHKRLDAAVFAAYGWPHDLSDEEILARLLALNLARAKG